MNAPDNRELKSDVRNMALTYLIVIAVVVVAFFYFWGSVPQFEVRSTTIAPEEAAVPR